MLCVIAQGSAGVVATNAGSLSNHVGRKPLIYMSCFVIASVYVGYIFVSSYWYVCVLGLIYGASNGVYLAVDYALAVECLPNPAEDTAKDMSLWGIAAFLGACLGPAITGPALTIVGAQDGAGSTSEAEVTVAAACSNNTFSNTTACEAADCSGSACVWTPAYTPYRYEGYVTIMLMGVAFSFFCGTFVMRVKRGNAPASHVPLDQSEEVEEDGPAVEP